MAALYIFLILLAIILVLLFSPMRYRANASFGADTRITLNISWLMRLVRVRFEFKQKESNLYIKLAWLDLTKRRKRETRGEKRETERPAEQRIKNINQQKSDKNKKRSNEKKRGEGNGIIAYTRGLLTEYDYKTIMDIARRFISKSARALKPDAFDAEGTLGLNDPAATGFLLGAYEAIAGYFDIRKHIRINGDYNERVVELSAYMAGRVSAGSVLWPVIWLCTRKPVFKMILKR